MHFLVDANLPLSTASLIQRCGCQATDVREAKMGMAEDSVIAQYAREQGFCLITRDKDFGDIRNYPPADYAGIVILELPDDTIAVDILKLIESFLYHKEWLEQLPGRLAIVELWRVRFRPS